MERSGYYQGHNKKGTQGGGMKITSTFKAFKEQFELDSTYGIHLKVEGHVRLPNSRRPFEHRLAIIATSSKTGCAPVMAVWSARWNEWRLRVKGFKEYANIIVDGVDESVTD